MKVEAGAGQAMRRSERLAQAQPEQQVRRDDRE